MAQRDRWPEMLKRVESLLAVARASGGQRASVFDGVTTVEVVIDSAWRPPLTAQDLPPPGPQPAASPPDPEAQRERLARRAMRAVPR
jgi:hypothetical protein